MASKPWWYTFAKVGEAVGAGVKVFAGVAQVIPVVPVQVVGTILGAAEGPISAEAEKGIKEVDGSSK